MPTNLFEGDPGVSEYTPRSLDALATRQDPIGLSLYTLWELQRLLAGTCELVANGLLITQHLRQVTNGQRRSKRSQMSENSVIGYLFGVGALLMQAHEKIDEREYAVVEQRVAQMITVLPGNQVAQPRGFTVMSYPSAQAAIRDTVSGCLGEIVAATDGFIRMGQAIASGRMEQVLKNRGSDAS